MVTIKKLDCGIRLVSEPLPDIQSACIGIWIGAGSAYENEKNAGISHFIEHMFFKGTAKRTAKQIAEDMDNLGAQFNAFTGKEGTCFHAKAITELFPQVCEILLDQLTGSLFDPDEMNRERKVILEEMSMIEDTPDDYVLDLLSRNVLDGTDLAPDVIGTRDSLAGITREDIISYINSNYTKDRIVVSVVGNFNETELIEQLNGYLSDFGEKGPERSGKALSGKILFTDLKKDVGQSHIALGIPTITLSSDEYYVQTIVNEVLGGSMSSRLFQKIREEMGLAYTVYSCTTAYSNAGMLNIYAAVTLGKEKATVDAIGNELRQMAKAGISSTELESVKTRIKSSYIFGLERSESRMFRNGKNLLILNRLYSQEEVMAEINAVTADQVNEFMYRISDISLYSGAGISKDKLDLKSLIG